MTPQVLAFVAPEAAFETAFAALGGALDAAGPAVSTDVLDSFDRRLRAAGLMATSAPGGSRLATRDGDEVLWRGRRALKPGRAPDNLMAAAGGAPHPRPLMRLATVRMSARTGELRDAAQKRIAHARLEGLATGELRLTLTPLRGYGPETAAVAAELAHRLNGAPGPALDDWLLRSAGVDPAALARKPAPPDPQTPATQAVAAMIDGLLAVIQANLPGALDGADIEHMHDLRVATRRARALLGQSRGVLCDAATAHLRTALADLGRTTTALRDLDVATAELATWARHLPRDLAGALDPVARMLASDRRKALSATRAALGDERGATMVAGLRDVLQRARPGPAGARPVGDLAWARARKLRRALLREGDAISPQSPPEALHDLRKTAKKLRYVLEAYETAFAASAWSALRESLRDLQDLLGAYQDGSVQDDLMRVWAERLARRSDAPRDTLQAIGVLRGRLALTAEQARDRFAGGLSAFSSIPLRRADENGDGGKT